MHNPHMPDIPMNREVTYFARTNFRGGNEIFGIKRKDRRQHMYVLGKSGTGKTTLLSNLVIQNIWNSEGLCLVDPHGEVVESVLAMIPDHRVEDVVYFNPADTEFCIGFNPLELHDPKYKHLVASGLMGIFTKIWANVWSPRMEHIMNNTILALLDTPGTTLLGITRMLVDKEYRQIIVDNVKDPMVKSFWVHEFEQWKEQFRNEAIAPIQNKVGQFLSSSIIRNIVGQQESSIDIFQLMNEGKILLVNVSKGRIGEDNSALLGAMIITKLQLAAMERVRIPEDERRDFYLYVDEFQNFATDSFSNILSEARKYRLCLTLAHQYTAQIESGEANNLRDAVFGNVGSMIIFRVGAEDATALEKEFSPEFTPEDFVGLPNYQIYLKLMIDGITSRPFSATTLPPIKVDSEFDSTQKVVDSSRRKYCRPQDKIEATIMAWSSDFGTVAKKDGIYNAVCSNCNKIITVPFEPIHGKPVYCKECLAKIKSGELKPLNGFFTKTEEGNSNKENKEESNKVIPTKEFSAPKPAVIKTASNSAPVYKKPFEKKEEDVIKKEINETKDQILKQKPDQKNNDGFTNLRDLLSNLSKNDSTKSPNLITPTKKVEVIKPDPSKITLHSKVTKTPERSNIPKVIVPMPTKSATNESKNSLKQIMSQFKPNTAPIPKKDLIRESATPAPENKTNNPINKNTEAGKGTSPNPATYQKRTPAKEVPEDVLREIFTEEETDKPKK